MGNIPLNLIGNRSNDFTLNIAGLTSNEPSVGQQLLGTFLGIGTLLATGAICRYADRAGGYGGGDSSVAAEPTQEQLLEGVIKNGNLELARYDAQLAAYETSITELTQKTNDDYIKGKASAAADANKELDNHKDLVKEIERNNTRISNATASVKTCQTQFDSSSRQLQSAERNLEAAKLNFEDADEEDKSILQEKVDRAQEQVETKKALHDTNKAKLEAAQKELDAANKEKTDLEKNNNNYADVLGKLNTYNALDAEAKSLKKNLENNNKQLAQTIADRDKLLNVTIPELQTKIQQAEDELALLQAEQRSGKKKASKQYAEADANDGNWWKRNMPSWLGGSKKANKAIYKENHALKQEAESTLSSFGTSQKEIINQRLTRFINKNPNLKGNSKQILKYIKDHPYASDDDIKTNYNTYK